MSQTSKVIFIGLIAIGLLTAPLYSLAQYSKVTDFGPALNGTQPEGSLIHIGGFAYGTSVMGGTSNLGTIFRIKSDGTSHTKLLDFGGVPSGSHPNGSLIFDGSFLFGMTTHGGLNNEGTLFRIKPDGTAYSKLLDFDNVPHGSAPHGSLVSDGTYLYGMTSHGGTNGHGTIFRIMHDGTLFLKLLDLNGPVTGSNPEGALTLSGTLLYGMTSSGGINGHGTVFEIESNGAGFVKRFDFAGASNGRSPQGTLVLDGNFLYGMTSFGGTADLGTLFKIRPDGTGYSKLLDFTGSNGSIPAREALVFRGEFLYGTTFYGGSNNTGTLIRVKPDGTAYEKLLDFSSSGSNANGNGPSSLSYDGTSLYGLTSQGGANDFGAVFKYCFLSKPIITVDLTEPWAPTLTSSLASSYSWFMDGAPVGDSQTIVATAPGVYTLQQKFDGCVSEISNPETITIVTGVHDSQTESLVVLYPNPSAHKLNVFLGGFEKAPALISIYDSQGRVVETRTGYGQQEVQFDVRNYAVGKYVVNACQNTTNVSRSFIKAD